MWLFVPYGFFSIVSDPEHADVLVVRARVRADLVRLIKENLELDEAKIETLPNRDYPYRIFAKYEDIQAVMLRAVNHINYTNFKSEVRRKLGPEREDLYHDVWSVMHDAEAKLRNPPRRETLGFFPGGEPQKTYPGLPDIPDRNQEKPWVAPKKRHR